MAGLRILITNSNYAVRGGAELYVRDLASALLDRGHLPIAYSTVLGEAARELRSLTIPVVDNLNALAQPPDLIHGQDHLHTMEALLHFPGVPAVFFCHGWASWDAAPPQFTRLRRYVAVDHACRDRLLYEHAITEERVCVLLNFVDLTRFRPRGPLPARPTRALILSNYASEDKQITAIRQACSQAGVVLDIVGASMGNATTQPEEILGDYDLVFARGRSALEALAVGAAVILYGAEGVGPMVTTNEFERLRVLNFGLRALRQPITADVLAGEIARYDPQDAAEVSRRIRATTGRDAVVDQIVNLYQEVLAEHASAGGQDMAVEMREAAAYLRSILPRIKENDLLRAERAEFCADREWLKAECAKLQAERVELFADREWLKGELAAARSSQTSDLRERPLQLPWLAAIYQAWLRKWAELRGKA